MDNRASVLKKRNKLANWQHFYTAGYYRVHGGKLGDVAKGIGGTLVSPPLDVRGVELYLGNNKRFPATDVPFGNSN